MALPNSNVALVCRNPCGVIDATPAVAMISACICAQKASREFVTTDQEFVDLFDHFEFTLGFAALHRLIKVNPEREAGRPWAPVGYFTNRIPNQVPAADRFQRHVERGTDAALIDGDFGIPSVARIEELTALYRRRVG